MSEPWYDPETGFLNLDPYVVKRPSFRKVMEDGHVTEEEVAEQADRVISRLKSVEAIADPVARKVAIDALCEMAVLYTLERHRHSKVM
ncbi:hypothetical protein [Aquisphaera insulae]|uniref:hypothetical protein n=1 Tax=Aquisphaera insulae TaxID=2712864 RepID=UPI0013EDD51B|nr:hypothetical protein [Aquisphaera insulae]